jgi:hypothetical protein
MEKINFTTFNSDCFIDSFDALDVHFECSSPFSDAQVKNNSKYYMKKGN